MQAVCDDIQVLYSPLIIAAMAFGLCCSPDVIPRPRGVCAHARTREMFSRNQLLSSHSLSPGDPPQGYHQPGLQPELLPRLQPYAGED